MFKKIHPEALYRPLIRDAWSLVWHNKRLWVFGFFAALISTGGVFDVVFRTFKRVDNTSEFLHSIANGSFAGFELLGFYIQQLSLLPISRISGTITFLALITIILVVFAIYSQKTIIENLKKQKKLDHIFFRVLELAFLTKATFAILMMLSTYVVLSLLDYHNNLEGIIFFLVFLAFFPLVIIVSIISSIALMDIVRKGTHALDAIQNAFKYFVKHWLITFELGVVLFFVVLFFGILTLLGISLLAIPYALLQLFFIWIGWTPVLFFVHFIALITLITVSVLFIGITTTFQYSAWLLFYERAVKKQTAEKMRSKIHRLFHFR
ncbi:MAG: hypothetical protein ABIH21_02740 [Patescibacteria group bacterium]